MSERAYPRREYNLRYRQKHRPPCRNCDKPIPWPSPGAKYCSLKCSKEARQRQNKLRQAQLAQELSHYKTALGCVRCGYNKCGAALDFHHPDENKERRITVKSWKTPLGQAEIEKCILLCANCHREEHNNTKIAANGDVYPESILTEETNDDIS